MTASHHRGIGSSDVGKVDWRRRAIRPAADTPRKILDVALVNNMPDAALDATERQFRDLLRAAPDGVEVNLTLYTLPEVARTDFGRRQVSKYASFGSLWGRHHDGLIVTGTEPHTADLQNEPYWSSLTRLL